MLTKAVTVTPSGLTGTVTLSSFASNLAAAPSTTAEAISQPSGARSRSSTLESGVLGAWPAGASIAMLACNAAPV